MPVALRLAFVTLFFGLTLAACGRTVQEDAPESIADTLQEERDAVTSTGEETEAEGEFVYLNDLIRTFRNSTNQAEMDGAVTNARSDGYSDQEIASAMGVANLLAPARRVLISVSFVRFKAGSAVPPHELDAAFEYAATPPRMREEEEETAEPEAASTEETASTGDASPEEASDEEDADEEEAPRRRGWMSWIPGL